CTRNYYDYDEGYYFDYW
nr:immunoglobulin heavy chain junction region [Mus musculus]MBK4197365.1 immunoglobulin heavy chain junction region [Mus musculus]